MQWRSSEMGDLLIKSFENPDEVFPLRGATA
jgi:hypothetical protein